MKPVISVSGKQLGMPGMPLSPSRDLLPGTLVQTRVCEGWKIEVVSES
jgi:hypothetical protein